MGTGSKIEWTTHTFNPWIGCLKIQPECTHCYAAVETFPRVQRAKGLELWGPPKTTTRHRTGPDNWKQPLKWNRDAALNDHLQVALTGRSPARPRVFCASMADVFEDNPILVPWRDDLLELIEKTDELDWLLLTKRPENMVRMAEHRWGDKWPEHVWAGTTGGTQKTLDANVTALKKVPAVTRFVSCEPLLERVTLFSVDEDGQHSVGWNLTAVQHRTDYGTGVEHDVDAQPGIDWCIVGGESGSNARPCAIEWLQSLVDECRVAGVAAFVKQLGSVVVSELRTATAEDFRGITGRAAKSPLAPNGEHWAWSAGLKHRKGGDIDEFPNSLQVREFPEAHQ